METAEIALLALAVVGFGLVSARVDRWAVTMPMVFVACGALGDATGLVRLSVETEGVVLIGELTLAVILFGDAVRIDLGALRRELGLPVRLLGIGLPLSILIGTGLAAGLLGEVSIWEAALVAAVLTPTDAALGQAVVEAEAVPLRIRQGLNVESGLNDGMAVPVVLLLIAVSGGEANTDAGFWAEFALQQVVGGVAIGLTTGAGIAWLITRARQHGYVESTYAQLATVALAVLAFAAALAVGGNGFIATFVAGLAFAGVAGCGPAATLDEYTEDSGRLLSMITFFLFGNLFVNDALGATTVAVVACSVALLTVGRLVPVAVALLGVGARWPTVCFVGWFGPRGLASILFGLLLLEEELPAADRLFAVIAWTVVASVYLHGATASWGAGHYGRWYQATPDDERRDMAESQPVSVHRSRWRRRE